MRNKSQQLCTSGAGRLFSFRSPAMGESPYFLLDFRNVLVDHGRIEPPRPETGDERDEYFRLSPGAIRLACGAAPGTPVDDLSGALLGNDRFTGGDWFSSTYDFLAATQLTDPAGAFPYDDCEAVVEEPTMFVKRFEYANLYHQSTDYVNVEIARHLLQIDNLSIAVELFDGHRHSELDEIWERVFNSDTQPATLPPHKLLSRLNSRLRRHVVSRICYKRLILVSPGYASRSFAMHTMSDPCSVPSPFYASMRARFLRAFRVTEAQAKADPSRCLIIARRDYQAHPRNVQGTITRKFADEQMVVRAAVNAGMQCSVIDLARMPVETQVQRIAQASILMGIHGAGLSFVYLLPPTASLVEARVDYNSHFENMAGYSGRRYIGFESMGVHEQDRIALDEAELTKVFRQAISMQHHKYPQ